MLRSLESPDLLESDSDIFGGTTKEEEEKERDVADSFRVFTDDDDDDDEDESIFGRYRKTKSGQDILDEYKKSFSFGSFF